jgi:thiopeptide-type bacteriocin biosynthesis protein
MFAEIRVGPAGKLAGPTWILFSPPQLATADAKECLTMSELHPADFFLLRTPSLPWDVVRNWSDGLRACQHTGDGDGESSAASDEMVLRSRLREIVSRPQVRHALQVASPSLHARLPAWLNGDDSEKALVIEPALVRYLSRMVGRATPFGLFAGYSIGRASDQTNLAVPAVTSYSRCTRLNLDVMYALATSLARHDAYRPHIRYRSNGTAYRIGERLRYYSVAVDSTTPPKTARKYSICELAANPHIDIALAAGRNPAGATLEMMATAIVAAVGEVDNEDARDYVRQLIDAGLFWPTLLPPVTGADPARHLLAELRKVPNAAQAADLLESALGDMASLDVVDDVDDAASLCEQIATKMRAIGLEVDIANLLKVDLRKPAGDPTIKRSILRDITAAVELVGAMAPSEGSAIHAFARNFEERYQGREVLLLEALDPEAGIGFEEPDSDSSPLINGLAFDSPPSNEVAWGKRESLLLEKLVGALRSNATEIRLSDVEIASMSTAKRKPLPPGLTVAVSLAASSTAALDRGDYQMMVVSGNHTTSAALLGRFLHDDPELERQVRAALQREQEHDCGAIHAEIAHHLEGPIGAIKAATNISRRPILREYEIDVIAASGAAADRRIALDDLLVSVKAGKVVLRSRALGRRVIPHLSTAHAFQGPGASVYRFLASLQLQEVDAVAPWSWGAALSQAPFLPRVTHGRIVLALATWRLSPAVVAALARTGRAARVRGVQKLRAEHRLPRHVCLVDGDNTLPIDLENVLSIDSLLSVIKGRSTIVLREQFPDPDALVARGPDGAFYHELFVPALRAERPGAVARVDAKPQRIGPTQDRAQLPGGEWLFAKVYCGTTTRDRFLVNVVAPLVKELRTDGLIDRWFFIRYADPTGHLRIRFHGAPQRLWTEVAPRFFALASSMRGHVAKIAIDTYDPEVERYGGDAAIELAHVLFEADSDAALRILAEFRTDTNARWRMALFSMDALLDDLDLELAQKRAVVASARDAWARNLGAGTKTHQKLGDNFRRMRRELEDLLRRPPTKLVAGIDALRARSAAVQPIASQLRQLDRDGRLSIPRLQIVESHLHMAANRLFRGAANRHEFALYDLLFRLYDGALCREHSRSDTRECAEGELGIARALAVQADA